MFISVALSDLLLKAIKHTKMRLLRLYDLSEDALRRVLFYAHLQLADLLKTGDTLLQLKLFHALEDTHWAATTSGLVQIWQYSRFTKPRRLRLHPAIKSETVYSSIHSLESRVNLFKSLNPAVRYENDALLSRFTLDEIRQHTLKCEYNIRLLHQLLLAPWATNLTIIHINGLNLNEYGSFTDTDTDESPFRSLRKLTMSCCTLRNWPTIALSSALHTLNLEGNNLMYIPSRVSKLAGLTDLRLCHNLIMALPNELRALSQLTCLNLGCNVLMGVSNDEYNNNDRHDITVTQKDGLCVEKGFDSLEELYLYNNELIVEPIPIDFYKQRGKTLRVLNLSDVNIGLLPPEISYMIKLERLFISNCRLKALPVDLGQLPCLVDLKLNSLEPIIMPDGFMALEELEMNGGGFKSIDFSRTCPKLQRLNLSFSKTIEMENLYLLAPTLVELSLEGCGIDRLPNGVDKCVNLEWLVLSDNPLLQTIPETIAKLSKLETIMIVKCPGIDKSKLPKTNNFVEEESDAITLIIKRWFD